MKSKRCHAPHLRLCQFDAHAHGMNGINRTHSQPKAYRWDEREMGTRNSWRNVCEVPTFRFSATNSKRWAHSFTTVDINSLQLTLSGTRSPACVVYFCSCPIPMPSLSFQTAPGHSLTVDCKSDGLHNIILHKYILEVECSRIWNAQQKVWRTKTPTFINTLCI